MIAEVLDEGGPLDPRLHANRSRLSIECDHLVERPHVEQQTPGAELLAAHRVPTPGDCDGQVGLRRAPDRVLRTSRRSNLDDLVHGRLVEFGVDVVDDQGHRPGWSTTLLKVRSRTGAPTR
jgi:hypothetical protein